MNLLFEAVPSSVEIIGTAAANKASKNTRNGTDSKTKNKKQNLPNKMALLTQ